ncbi:hypothetical protein INS90_09430 [Trueperella pecoris]|uniref:HD domain-containing protein n=1 Tax=Trueperella pecoris TaxID=2733571 RepID=A0A7M1R1A5_9ACTO|nr:hypothetical protein [Trueperella pecoris]QOR47454.1 hypothetical protein INS90_09430 [Trueperella pecoris]
MSRNVVPQWVTQSFVRSAIAVGATSPRDDIERVCYHLIELWSSPGRTYHDTQHLFDHLARIDALAAEAHDADVVRLAAWGHGLVFSTDGQAIYTRNGGEDRGASAALAAKHFLDLGIPPQTVEAIRELIGHMRRHPLPLPESGIYEAEDMDLLVLTDAHLGSLASQPQKYKKYMEKVREEYAHIPDIHFLEARLEVVTRLLDRRRIYTTPLAAQWEDSARQNLQLERQRLLAKLEKVNTGLIPVIRVDDNGNPIPPVTLSESVATATALTEPTSPTPTSAEPTGPTVPFGACAEEVEVPASGIDEPAAGGVVAGGDATSGVVAGEAAVDRAVDAGSRETPVAAEGGSGLAPAGASASVPAPAAPATATDPAHTGDTSSLEDKPLAPNPEQAQPSTSTDPDGPLEAGPDGIEPRTSLTEPPTSELAWIKEDAASGDSAVSGDEPGSAAHHGEPPAEPDVSSTEPTVSSAGQAVPPAEPTRTSEAGNDAENNAEALESPDEPGDVTAEPRATTPGAAPSQTVHQGSSLEEVSEDLEPGSPRRALTAEEVKQARRDEIARATREKIERAKDKDAERRDFGGEFPRSLVE